MNERVATTKEIWTRIDSLGIDVDRSKYSGDYLSSLDICNLADETGQSLHWLITGERDPYEPKMVFCDNPYPFKE